MQSGLCHVLPSFPVGEVSTPTVARRREPACGPRPRCARRRCRRRRGAPRACPTRASRRPRGSRPGALVEARERGEHRLPEPAFGPVVLDGEDRSGRLRSRRQPGCVDRLHGVAVDDTRRDPLVREGLSRGERLVDRDAGGDDRDVVLVRGPDDPAAADRELLVRLVEDRRRAAGRSEVADALALGHGGDELRRLVGVARVEHGAAADRAHHRQVLERHLRRAVLADRDAGVRPADGDRGAADGGHADEVVGAREEGGEGGGERLPAAHLHPDRGGDELLLGDEHLEEALGVGGGEDVGMGRVRHLAVEGDDAAVRGADRRERVAVGLAGRHLLAQVVARQLERSGGEDVRLGALRLGERRPSGRVGRPAPRSPPRDRRAPCRAHPPCPPPP